MKSTIFVVTNDRNFKPSWWLRFRRKVVTITTDAETEQLEVLLEALVVPMESYVERLH